jgi:hypothetical protein
MLKTKIALMLGAVAVTTATLAPSNSAAAATLTYAGALANPNSIGSFFFTSDGSSNATFKSYSYNSGTSTNGTTFGGGGFNPLLSIFGPIVVNPTTTLQDQFLFEIDRLPGAGDISFTTAGRLARGNYRAVISVAPNFPQGSTFADGYTNTNTTFGNGRTSFYAFDISGSGVTATVPEPTSIVGTMIAGMVAMKLKRKLSASNNIKKLKVES